MKSEREASEPELSAGLTRRHVVGAIAAALLVGMVGAIHFAAPHLASSAPKTLLPLLGAVAPGVCANGAGEPIETRRLISALHSEGIDVHPDSALCTLDAVAFLTNEGTDTEFSGYVQCAVSPEALAGLRSDEVSQSDLLRGGGQELTVANVRCAVNFRGDRAKEQLETLRRALTRLAIE
jgi:hypothetical protein